jgi:hypothetical protein
MAAETWKFRGPKAYPLLKDTRHTKEEKKHEFERLMQILHNEFFMKQRMGHTRLAQARARFYRTVADYKTLTGKDHVDLKFADLPDVPDSFYEADQVEEIVDDTLTSTGDGTNVVRIPGVMPSCFHRCVAEQYCYGDPDPWTQGEACDCFTKWFHCSTDNNICDESQRAADQDTEDFFTGIFTRREEVCVYGKMQNLKDHLGWVQKAKRPANSTTDGDAELTTGSLLQGETEDEAEDRPLLLAGMTLMPLLESMSLQESSTKPKLTNPPSGCQVSNPEMLGDGKCDYGDYNTEACNFDGGDCCETDCRPAFHQCGSEGYQCQGPRVGVRIADNFGCNAGKKEEFRDYYEKLRDELTLGSAMLSAQCSGKLSVEEHNNLAQAFNIGIELGWNKKTNQAAARVGGPSLFIDCDLWDNEIGSEWFGSLIAHELGHSAGYGHPKFKANVFHSECENIGSTYCSSHCMEWTDACQNHFIFGSKGCGFANMGCMTTCVHDQYCNSVPERVTECFGYMKVHSRGEGLSEKGVVGSIVSKATDTIANILGFGRAPGTSVALPFLLVVIFNAAFRQ